MRSVLALGLLITLCASANAATVHRTLHARTRPHVVVPGQGATTRHFAVPGWSDGATRRRPDNASSSWTGA